jgi:hypothetical protein
MLDDDKISIKILFKKNLLSKFLAMCDPMIHRAHRKMMKIVYNTTKKLLPNCDPTCSRHPEISSLLFSFEIPNRHLQSYRHKLWLKRVREALNY